MSSDFMRSNINIDKAVIDATTGPDAGYEHMRAALRTQLQADGIIVRDRESELGTRMMPGHEPVPEVALP